MHRIKMHEAGDAFWAHDASSDVRVEICPIPIPTLTERYMWIDQTFPVRSVMFPLAKSVGNKFIHVVSYAHMGFNWRYMDKTQIWTNDGTSRTIGEYGQHLSYGWNYLNGSYNTMRIDCRAAYLCLWVKPEQREVSKGLYYPNTIVEVFRASDITYSIHRPYSDAHMVPHSWMKDFRAFISENTGITMLPPPIPVVAPYLLIAFFKSLASLGLSLIPYIGPLLAISSELGMEAILEPDSFPKDALGLAFGIVGGIISSGKDIVEYRKKNTKDGGDDEDVDLSGPIKAMKEWIALNEQELNIAYGLGRITEVHDDLPGIG